MQSIFFSSPADKEFLNALAKRLIGDESGVVPLTVFVPLPADMIRQSRNRLVESEMPPPPPVCRGDAKVRGPATAVPVEEIFHLNGLANSGIDLSTSPHLPPYPTKEINRSVMLQEDSRFEGSSESRSSHPPSWNGNGGNVSFEQLLVDGRITSEQYVRLISDQQANQRREREVEILRQILKSEGRPEL